MARPTYSEARRPLIVPPTTRRQGEWQSRVGRSPILARLDDACRVFGSERVYVEVVGTLCALSFLGVLFWFAAVIL